MGILDYLILAGIAVGILAAVRHLKKNVAAVVEIVATVRRKNRKILAKFSVQRISMG